MVYCGTSFSGGNVIHAAATDKHIKAAIAQALSVSGETRSLEFKDQIHELFNNRARIATSGQRDRVLCITSTAEEAQTGTAPVLFSDLHAYESYSQIPDCGGKWGNYVTEQTQLHMLWFEPQAYMYRIAPKSFFMVIPGNDVMVKTSSQAEAFGKARELKQMLFLKGAGHFDIYQGEWFERNIRVQVEFLRRCLTE